MFNSEDLTNDDVKVVNEIPVDFYKKNKTPALADNQHVNHEFRKDASNYPTKATHILKQRNFH